MDENQCPVCGHLTTISGLEEYIEVDPKDMTKGTKKTLIHRACINPDCSNFAGDPFNPTVEVSIPYEKGAGKAIEKDNRPNVDFNNVSKVASTTTLEDTLPVNVAALKTSQKALIWLLKKT